MSGGLKRIDVRPLDVLTDSSGLKDVHRIFRFPAKFHPPVVDTLLRKYTVEGDMVLDPFCGSGTVMVEAQALGRRSVGSDVDPLAVFVSRTKTRRYDLHAVEGAFAELELTLAAHDRGETEYKRLEFADLDDSEYQQAAEGLTIPEVPLLEHWFRRYAVIDLARIRESISNVDTDDETRDLMLLAFAAIIRNSSNADPVPVSGLEVTAHMKRKDAEGRVVNPFALFRAASVRARRAASAWLDATGSKTPLPQVFAADATKLELEHTVDAVVTSPPYHNAVDYYRRHQLEMYWLGLTKTRAERLKILPTYIGRPRVPLSQPALAAPWNPSPIAHEWETEIAKTSEQRARDFRSYMSSMGQVFERLAAVLPGGAPAVFVVGRSLWNGASIPTDSLFVELAAGRFDLSEHLTYPVKNRYMSYARHNGASIDTEHVLVLRRI